MYEIFYGYLGSEVTLKHLGKQSNDAFLIFCINNVSFTGVYVNDC